jgi:hypothetical protein
VISYLRRRVAAALDRRVAAGVEAVDARTRAAVTELQAHLDARQDERKRDSDQRLAEGLEGTSQNIVSAVTGDPVGPDPVSDGLETLVDAVARLNAEVAELRARLDPEAADR